MANNVMMQYAVPQLNPVAAPLAVCPTCSEVVEARVESQANGRLLGVYYEHVNQEKGCRWRLDVSTQHIIGQIRALKDAEVAKLLPAPEPEVKG